MHLGLARGMRGRNVGLALQGGGSYAAFTGGVLQALFRPRRGFLAPGQVRSVSGTSGGALNAALLGLALHRGHEDPTAYVRRLWELNRLERLAKERYAYLQLLPDQLLAMLLGMTRGWLETKGAAALASSERLKNHAAQLIDELVRTAAPGLEEDTDAPLLRARPPYVTVAATELRSAVAHYFTNDDRLIQRYQQLGVSERRDVMKSLSLRSVYASMAHPAAFHPVAIGEDRYIDGYYTCNPPFVYLFREGCDEVLLVRLVQQQRDLPDYGDAALRDRTEEITQNSTVNLEIMTYLAMRELALSNLGRHREAELRLGLKGFSAGTIFHEIRLLKPGNISDQGYPFARLVERLLELGKRAVSARDGFARTYRRAQPGLQVVSEVDFESGEVRSEVVDMDRLLFGEPPAAGGRLRRIMGGWLA